MVASEAFLRAWLLWWLSSPLLRGVLVVVCFVVAAVFDRRSGCSWLLCASGGLACPCDEARGPRRYTPWIPVKYVCVLSGCVIVVIRFLGAGSWRGGLLVSVLVGWLILIVRSRLLWIRVRGCIRMLSWSVGRASCLACWRSWRGRGLVGVVGTGCVLVGVVVMRVFVGCLLFGRGSRWLLAFLACDWCCWGFGGGRRCVGCSLAGSARFCRPGGSVGWLLVSLGWLGFAQCVFGYGFPAGRGAARGGGVAGACLVMVCLAVVWWVLLLLVVWAGGCRWFPVTWFVSLGMGVSPVCRGRVRVWPPLRGG